MTTLYGDQWVLPAYVYAVIALTALATGWWQPLRPVVRIARAIRERLMNLPRNVRVDVTADDIANGVVSSDSCPIAIAFRRAVPAAFHVNVDPYRIAAGEPAESGLFSSARYELPDEAHAFVVAFDDPFTFGPVEPFTFEVTAS